MTTPPCRACGKTDPVLCYPDNHALAICPDCCAKVEHASGETGHCFEYERGERRHACTECGIPRDCTDYEPEHFDDDVPLMTAREFRGDRPLGIPLSELSGRPGPADDLGHPDHARYENFKRIARSWGFE